MKKQISVHELKYGMWVSEPDRSWLETPFLFQGFEIQSKEEIETLRSICGHVYIDTDLGCDVEPHASAIGSGTNNPTDHAAHVGATYQDQTSVEEELEAAKEIYANSEVALTEIMDGVRLEKKINSRQVKQTVTSIADSIIRNPNAFTLLTRLKDKDSYTYLHCLDVCALSLIFGRQLGFAKEELEVLGIGTLLLDIGKLRIPTELLEKPDKLTPAEFKVIETHVSHSVDIMSKAKGVPPDSIEIAHTHHERDNGRGYPRKLAGKQIPIFGKMAAIVDCYDAMTSDAVYRCAISSHKALRTLYARKDEEFQAGLIEQFIQCIGVYPVGSLVELTTGEVGVVLSQNRVRRLRPEIMLILDEHKKAIESGAVIDLMKELSDSSGNPLEIKDVLEPGAYGIDTKEFFL
ncbi:MAG: HD-GYP domain-containing protein [Gammaproteobacteria bacterium]